ncbi:MULTISPECIES: DNA-directed RNA polymerase subunit beta' [Brevibacterium]|uniref:DNA-directed RNA polymerase subunit beta' n=1 Tax=Brevibacterium luteolum TaxID=199591 RepID=A0A2N6PJ59_9MICO|nr:MULTISPECIES: DNA-directed RNA polymerase subunit beta' [Brevibacterium]MCT1828363.1 DNA-directed RNA polymerase subunit beta' [Brevibacterium luteolum]MCT1872294.1 DNA-directed RNA polymerase subunit beta' [Brevibacterium luteolum]MCT1889497.1 DNA-directed RNA polymerase subunit beta' [Brevibacterium luteolum]MCT1892055.1 DNA-directed RNA polymerase subunit beta' [Brevibacterium luteolum]MCT1921654.1 DNA-directed RNA polymerase subunit beta' [Brevibacterium luteolum]
MPDVNFFDELRIGLATADDIRRWSHGEVKKPETINYRTLKPEKDGLFCEKIFGPTRDWECYCGKYKRVRFKGIICERCGVEVTRAKVRRERMGHIELAAPVTHIWYFKGVPSRLGYLLDLAPKDLEKVIYFAAYMITSVDEESRHRDLPTLQNQIDVEKKRIGDRRDADLDRRSKKLEEDLAELESEGATAAAKNKLRTQAEKEMNNLRKNADREIDRIEQVWERFKGLKVSDLEGDESLYRDMVARFGIYFTGAMGAEAIQKRLQDFDLEGESDKLRELIKTGKGQRKTRALKRLKVVNAFLSTDNSPEGMVLDAIPVIPPELRPMVQLDGGRFATSDLNDLYRRVINRNNRLKRLLDLGAPEIIVNNEKRMLQEAVDSLFDNGRRGRPVTGPGNRPLKSLSDMLKGKQGRFRQNLLGKRVDYSGRSVIVVGPTLNLHECGLPKTMALELFKPFVMKRLVDLNHAQNIKSAKRMVERQHAQVWDVLEEVISEHPVLLNRAPTLHRLGIQAFEPLLVEGKAIQIHPLVCSAFNADFDGDQMAVHLPLSAEAQAEARILMLSANNILKPSDGKPVTMPSQDMIIGLYHLTSERSGSEGEGREFASIAEAIMAFDRDELNLGAKIKLRIDDIVPSRTMEMPEGWEPGQPAIVETTLGRALFNETLPADYQYVNSTVDKKALSKIVNRLADLYPKVEVAHTLDQFKSEGFYWATHSGLTVAMSDIVSPESKAGMLDEAEEQASRVQEQYDFGALTDDERRSELVKIWSDTSDQVAEAMQKNFPEENSVVRLVNSGASGNWTQVRQLAGMRGLVTNPKGEIIPRPIKSNYREGLSVLEYFIASHGARKGLADTALRTADSGYLTRRLVDVSQDVIIRSESTDSPKGITLPVAQRGVNGELEPHEFAETSVYGRLTVSDITDADGNVIVPAKTDVGPDVVDTLVAAGIEEIKVHSVLTADSDVQISAMHYGRSMATGKLVDIGEAIGTVAAQSIGEPGTQLTMRTFHTGGVAAGGGGDITQGLPRVTELFEARTPKGFAPIAEATGKVKIDDSRKTRYVIVTPDDGSEEIEHPVGRRAQLLVEDGQRVEAGSKLVEGAIDPKQVLRIRGRREAERFLVDEVQKVYRSQGVGIHDKHIEVIVRQMLRRVTVIESGDTNLLPGELVDRGRYQEENRRVVAEGGKPASARDELMGITKASLATESWLSAASFQETTRVLTEAAMEGKTDPLLGLKENVILGKLIPAGTGMHKYRDMIVEPTEEARQEMFSNSYNDFYPSLAGEGAAIPLEDYDFGAFS